jgi:hypothetical protein
MPLVANVMITIVRTRPTTLATFLDLDELITDVTLGKR